MLMYLHSAGGTTRIGMLFSDFQFFFRLVWLLLFLYWSIDRNDVLCADVPMLTESLNHAGLAGIPLLVVHHPDP